MGYAGGKAADPIYHRLGDHTEAVQVDFDPQQVSYSDLLRTFWESHRPTQRPWSRQYMNAVFFHNERQRRLAEASKTRRQKEIGRTVHTKIVSVETFYRAEDYHQKYLLKRYPGIAKAFERMYPRKRAYVDSTAVARVNGYVGGYGTAEQLRRELPQLGLAAAHRQLLEQLVSGSGGGWFN